MGNGAKVRRDEWTGSIAVGSQSFIAKVKSLLGFKAKGRNVIEDDEGYQLRGEAVNYTALFEAEKDTITCENNCFWDLSTE